MHTNIITQIDTNGKLYIKETKGDNFTLPLVIAELVLRFFWVLIREQNKKEGL